MRLLAIASVFVSSVALAHVALAQSADSVRTDSAKEVVITALRSPIVGDRIPYSMALQETPKNVTGLSLSEAVVTVPGLQISDRHNFAVGDRIVNRGIGARTQFGVRGVRLYLDNMPLTMPDGQSTTELIDPQDLSSIEMLRGPGSSLYGNASGGVLLLHTTRPNDDLRASATSTSGANALQKIGSHISGALGTSDLIGGYSHFTYGGFRAHSTASNERAIAKVATPLSSKDAFEVNAGYVKFNALNPGALTAKELAADPGQAAASSVSMNASKDGYHGELAATWKHLGDSSLSQVTLFGIKRNIHNPIVGSVIDLQRIGSGLSASYSNNTWLVGHNLQWTLGTDIALQSDGRKNHQNNSGVAGSLTLDQDESVLACGAFLQLASAITPAVDAVASMRYDRTAFHVTDHLVTDKNPDDSGDRSMDAASPAIGLVYHLSSNSELFANVSTAFETPTTTELANRESGAGGFNPALKPQHTTSYELGSRGALASWLRYDAAWYYMRLRDELIPYEVTSNPGRSYYRNAGEALHQGVEMMLIATPLREITARISASVIDAHFVSFQTASRDDASLKIPGIAQSRICEELEYRAPFGIMVSAVAQQVGRMAVNDSNSAFTEPYAVLELRMGNNIAFGNRFKTTLSLAVGVKNVLNKNYVSSVVVNAAAGRYYEPAESRYFYLTAALTFAASPNGSAVE